MTTFNPRHIPACPTSTAAIHQQANIAPDALSLEALQRRFSQPVLWRPQRLKEYQAANNKPLRLASVLIALQKQLNTQQLHVLFIQRSLQLPVHAGQIAFPGGKTDSTDRDAIHTALRETQEEVGIEADMVNILGHLPFYATGTGFLITPVVGVLAPNVQPIINSSEVDDAFYVPLSFLMNPTNCQQHKHYDDAGTYQTWYSIVYTEEKTKKERFIWGITAAIVRDLYHFLACNMPSV